MNYTSASSKNKINGCYQYYKKFNIKLLIYSHITILLLLSISLLNDFLYSNSILQESEEIQSDDNIENQSLMDIQLEIGNEQTKEEEQQQAEQTKSQDPIIPAEIIKDGDQSLMDIQVEIGNKQTKEQPTEEQQYELLVYENPGLGFQIQYPSNWIKEEAYKESIVSFASPLKNQITDKFHEILGLAISPTHSQTLQDYTITHLSKLMGSNMIDLDLLESQTNATLAGNPAHKLVYVHKGPGGIENKVMEVYTIKNGKLYDITYHGSTDEYPSSLSTAEEMINTFKIDGIIAVNGLDTSSVVSGIGQEQTAGTALPNGIPVPPQDKSSSSSRVHQIPNESTLTSNNSEVSLPKQTEGFNVCTLTNIC